MSIIESGNFRIESGPARKTSFASVELLDAISPHYRENMVDADGKPITLGGPFTYLDWGGTFVWYVYQKEDSGAWGELTVCLSAEDAQTFITRAA